jgi:hypothetical protein
MSGISPTSGSTSSLTSSYTSSLSSVGKSLLVSGSAPNAVPAAAANTATGLSSIQTEFNTLNTEDTQELLYASFLTPAESLANGNAVLEQAAALLGAPGSAASSLTTSSSTSGTNSSSTSGSNSSSTTGASSSASTASSSLNNLPSVASILAASDAEAAQTLQNYASAPPDSSIIDYQA